ncbi:MAG: hypothetical protein FJX72_16850, partial [Armatimonadetes bacterium]|nr:hypothetical protein [Armatimonadota bacterium]
MGRCRLAAQPLSRPLQTGIRFLPHPIPAPPSVRLAAPCLLAEERYGLTMFPTTDRIGSGPLSSPAAWENITPCPVAGDTRAPAPAASPFWFKPASIFGSLYITAFI